MGREQVLERERRWAKPAGYAAILIAPLYIASLFILTSTVTFGGLATEQLRVADANAGVLMLSSLLNALAALLMCIPLLYLFKAAQARSDRVSQAMVGFVFIGPVLLALRSLLSAVSQNQIASDFVAQASPGGDIYTLLDDLAEASTVAEVAGSLFFPAVLGLVVAMVYISLQAMRVGLVSRFFGTLGMALGGALVVIAPQLSLLAIAIWMGWLGFIYLDRVPRGRPPAWVAGEAIPWPKPGEQVPEPAADVIEGDATEAFAASADSADNAARRQRARKKKRKRRG
jgi:hypothetical protein